MKKQIGPFTFEEKDDEGHDIRCISEVMGVTDKAFDMLTKLIAVHQFKGFFIDNINTKTEAFRDFIEKNPEIMEKFNTPNDYLVIGMAWGRAMHLMNHLEDKIEDAKKHGKSGLDSLLEEIQGGSSDSKANEVKEAVAKKLRSLGLDGDIDMERIVAGSPEDAADQIAERIIQKKAEERKKNETKKSVN